MSQLKAIDAGPPDCLPESLSRSRMVVLIEPDTELREYLAKAAESHDFRTHIVNSSEEVIERLTSKRSAILIMNWNLPNNAAQELIRSVRSIHRIRRTHIIVCSAFAEQDAVSTALLCGADDFITFPINEFELGSRLQWAHHRGQTIV